MDERRCVLFADIAGSTRMYAEHGDDATREMLVGCLDRMEAVVSENRGRVVRRIGDELLCLFDRHDDAATASISLHTRVADASAKGVFAWPMRVRIGFEAGPVQESGGALFGNTVHTAARLASLAKAAQTLTSRTTLALLNPAIRCFTRYVDRVLFKGQNTEQDVYELLWSMPQATIAQRGRAAAAPRPAPKGGVVLTYAGRTYRVDPSHPRFEIGRDVSCDLVVQGPSVSMVHGRFLFERGRAEFEDVSSNGTVVQREGGPAVPVHRSRVTLVGAGMLHLGSDPEHGGAAVQYRIEP